MNSNGAKESDKNSNRDGSKSSMKRKLVDQDNDKEDNDDDDDDNDDEDGDDDDDDEDDDDDDDGDIGLVGNVEKQDIQNFEFEFNDIKEEYAESLTVLLTTLFPNPTLAYSISLQIVKQGMLLATSLLLLSLAVFDMS